MEHHDHKTFSEHLNELKKRSFIVLANFLLGAGLGFFLHKQIEEILQKPLGQTLYYSNPAGGLSFAMQISVGVGIITCLPLLLYQIMQFLRPALKPVKTRMVLVVIACSVGLAIMAVAYVYYVSLPASLNFLVSFNGESIKALIDVNDYARFVLAYCGAAILAFQLPLFLLFANKVRRFPPGSLTGLQRPVILGAIIAAGIITPTVDPINQMLLAVPIILLFETGVILVWGINRRARRSNSKAQAPAIITQQTQPKTEQPKPLVAYKQPRLSMDGLMMRPRQKQQSSNMSKPVARKLTPVKTSAPNSGAFIVMDIMTPRLSNPT